MPLLTLRGCLIEARNTIDQALPLAWRTGTCVLRGFSGGTGPGKPRDRGLELGHRLAPRDSQQRRLVTGLRCATSRSSDSDSSAGINGAGDLPLGAVGFVSAGRQPRIDDGICTELPGLLQHQVERLLLRELEV